MDTPPTSHRSHVAISGNRPMAACSAACAAPGTSDGFSAARAITESGTAHHSARVTRVCAGNARGTSSTISPVMWSFRTNPVTCRVTETSPKYAGVSPMRPSSSAFNTSMSVTSRDCV